MNMKKTAAGMLAILMLAMPFAAFGEAGVDTSTEVPAEAAPAEEAESMEAPVESTEPSEDTAAPEATAAPGASEANAAAEPDAGTDSQRLDAAYTLALNAITSEKYDVAREYIDVCFAYCDAQSNPVMFADLLLKRACIDVIEQKNDMALINLDAALRVKPDLADAYLVRTQVYAGLGDAERAIKDLEKYIELTQDTSLYQTVAQLQEARGDIHAAEAAYDKYVEGAGAGTEEAKFQSGLYKMESGSFEEAITAFEAYAENETYGAGAMYNIGVCRMNLGDYARAAEAFNSCEEKGGSFEGLYYNRGVCRLLAGEWEEASKDFEKSIETEPYADDALYNLGICRMQQNQYEDAVAAFTEYIGDGIPKEESGENETESGQPAEAPEGKKVNDGAYYYRAACRAALGQTQEAIADYTVCIEHQYEPGKCYYQRAQLYGTLGETEKQNADLAESLKYSN